MFIFQEIAACFQEGCNIYAVKRLEVVVIRVYKKDLYVKALHCEEQLSSLDQKTPSSL